MFPRLTGRRGSYALVGLGAFLAGATHAPLTAVLLLFEMTREYAITLPALLTCVLSLVVARSLEPESIDTYPLAREGKRLHIGNERHILTQIPVSTVMSQEPITLSNTDDLTEVLRATGETAQSTIPVINHEAELLGIVVHRDVIELLASKDSLGTFVNAYDLARPHPPAVMAESNLNEALQHMEAEGIDELPVVEGPSNRLIGLISRQAIAFEVNRATASLDALASRDTGIFWSTDYRIARIRVPAECTGNTLLELDLPARFAVTILAVTSSSPASGCALIDANHVLQQENLLVVAGRPASVRVFERYLNGFSEEPF
jgi:CBS domain-containing protein